MKAGAVMVDVAIDQGGCFETSRPTTHQDPTYVVDGVARTATMALTNATLPYALNPVDKGVSLALQEDVHLRSGLNIHSGMVTHGAVAAALDYEYVDPLRALGRTELRQTA